MIEDERGDVAGMRIAIADEATALRGLVDSGLKYPEILLGAAQRERRLRHNTATMVAFCEAQQVAVGYEAKLAMHGRIPH